MRVIPGGVVVDGGGPGGPPAGAASAAAITVVVNQIGVEVVKLGVGQRRNADGGGTANAWKKKKEYWPLYPDLII